MELNIYKDAIKKNTKGKFSLYRKKIQGSFGEIRETRTIKQGFNQYIYNYSKDTSVIDVGMDQFSIKTNNEVLITYGIITCCGLIAMDQDRTFLMHISPGTSAKQVIETLEDNQFKQDFQSVLVPGFACFIDYKDLLIKLKERSSSYSIHQFHGKYGVIVVENKNIIIGNNINIEKKIKMKKIPNRL